MLLSGVALCEAEVSLAIFDDL